MPEADDPRQNLLIVAACPVEGLNQPTSLEFIGNDTHVVTLGGEIWKIAGALR